MLNAKDTPSTRPYLLRALYEWCTDNGFTPYVAVKVDDSVRVPRDHVKNGEIVLNISFDATSSLKLGNEFIEFKARFAGKAQEIQVPLNRVIAIYARENGQGMAFPLNDSSASNSPTNTDSLTKSTTSNEASVKRVQLVPSDAVQNDDDPQPPRPTDRSRPSLKRVK